MDNNSNPSANVILNHAHKKEKSKDEKTRFYRLCIRLCMDYIIDLVDGTKHPQQCFVDGDEVEGPEFCIVVW